MQVCLISHLFPTRSETFVRDHAMGLTALGHKVTVVARTGGEDIADSETVHLQDAGIQQIYVGLPASRRVIWPEYCRQIWRHGPWVVPFAREIVQWSLHRSTESVCYLEALQHLRPDVVHVHFGDLGARMARLARYSGYPVPDIVTWHGYEATVLPRQHGQAMYRDLFDADCIHTVGSSFMHDRLLELGARADLVRVIPMGINLDRFSYREPDLSGDFRILSIGRLDQMKGHRYLIQAIESLRRRGIFVELRIIGDGPLKDDLTGLVHQLDLEDRVYLLGAMDSESVASYLSQAHVFALTGVVADNGRVETQGVVFAEAQARGVPVIASDVGGVRDSLIDGETGFLCPERDVESIAERLVYFNDHRDQIAIFGARGRSFVESRFSQASMLKRFEVLYQEAVK